MIDLKTQFKNAIQDNRLGHALLFLGEDSQKKQKTALELAAGLFCEQKVAPFGCQECLSCKQVSEKRYPYLRFLEPETEEASEIKIGQIRDLKTTPGNPSWIIPHAELLNPQASNALLKTLEEPRGNQFFILIAPNTRSILATLVSRCQRIFFKGRSQVELPEPVEIPESHLERLALIEKLVKSKTDIKELLIGWHKDASWQFKEKLLQAEQDLKRHVNPQLILESLLLSK